MLLKTLSLFSTSLSSRTALCLFPLQKGTFLSHSLAWLEIRDSLCPFILEYFLLISQFKFQLCNYILPTPNSSVISIGHGVLHSLGRTLAVLWGTVNRLPRLRSSPISCKWGKRIDLDPFELKLLLHIGETGVATE